MYKRILCTLLVMILLLTQTTFAVPLSAEDNGPPEQELFLETIPDDSGVLNDKTVINEDVVMPEMDDSAEAVVPETDDSIEAVFEPESQPASVLSVGGTSFETATEVTSGGYTYYGAPGQNIYYFKLSPALMNKTIFIEAYRLGSSVPEISLYRDSTYSFTIEYEADGHTYYSQKEYMAAYLRDYKTQGYYLEVKCAGEFALCITEDS